MPEFDAHQRPRPVSMAVPPVAASRGASVQPSSSGVPRIPTRLLPKKSSNMIGPYLLLQTVGEGEFAKVKLGMHIETGEEAAIKLIRKENVDSPSRLSKIQREINVLRRCRHPHVVRLYDVIETEKYIAIIMEYASGGELFDHILAHRYLKEKDACRLFAQLISGVSYMHERNIVHRDLKLENLLLDRNRNLIITDFGFANQFGEGQGENLMATSCGSPCYAAPELVVSEGVYVGTAVDIWSCGVILYAMLAGYLPFDDDPSNPDGDNINQLYKYILATPLVFPEYISPDARDLLRRMLVPDPLKRCDMPVIKEHRWMVPYAHVFTKKLDLDESDHVSEGVSQLAPPIVTDEAQNMRHTIQVEYGTDNKTDQFLAALSSPTRTTSLRAPSLAEEDEEDKAPLEDELLVGEFPTPPSSDNVSVSAASSDTFGVSEGKISLETVQVNVVPPAEDKKPKKGRESSKAKASGKDEPAPQVPDKSPRMSPAKTDRKSKRPSPVGSFASPTASSMAKASPTASFHTQSRTDSKRKSAAFNPTVSMPINQLANTKPVPEVPGGSTTAKRVMDWFRKGTLVSKTGATTAKQSGSTPTSTDPTLAKIRVNKGAVDQGALTSRHPKEVLEDVYRVLTELGCDWEKVGEFQVRASRPKRIAPDAIGKHGSQKQKHLTVTDDKSANGSADKSSGQRSKTATASKRASVFQTLLKRGNTEANNTARVITPRSPISPTAPTPPLAEEPVDKTEAVTSALSEATLADKPANPAFYGDPAIDNGDEIRFSVEVCKIRNLNDLYIVKVGRLRGNIWGFKVVYHALLEKLDLKSKGYMAMNGDAKVM